MMFAKNLKEGHILNIKDAGYFRVVGNGEGTNSVLIKRCEKDSPYDFADEKVIELDAGELILNENVEIVTWFLGGVFDSLKKRVINWEGFSV